MSGHGFRTWLDSSLNRKFLVFVIGSSIALCLAILVLLVNLYQKELETERREASLSVNRLLAAALENAMLNRDVAGLRTIVDRLGKQDGISNVMIVNPSNEVRFSSAPSLLGHVFSPTEAPTCNGCHTGRSRTQGETSFLSNELNLEVLRSVIPVRNKPQCVECHGSLEQNPVNGVLFVDYDAETIRDRARTSALMLVGSGGLVGLLTVGVSFWFLRRFVLRPVDRLADASEAIAAGQLNSRAAIEGGDELGLLGRKFDEMAAHLQHSHDRLAARDRFLQELIDAVPDGIRLIDGEFTIHTANMAYCQQLGLEQRVPKGAKCFASSHARCEPCVPTLITCPVHEIARKAKPLKTIQQHLRSDGTTFPVEIVAAPVVLDVDGEEKLMILESVRDLSQQVEFSQEQRLAEMDKLASGVAHGLRDPLASIQIALQAVMRSTTDRTVDVDALREYFQIIESEISKCVQVTRTLLNLSAPPDGRPRLVELNSVVSDTLSLLTFEAEQTGVVIESVPSPSNPRVLASDSEMRMIVLNLSQNALHAMPKGGHLTVSTTESPTEVSVHVADTGVGVRPEDAAHIFEPFYSHRADGVRGTGLGLSICKAIVTRYNGRIHFEERSESGTLFRIDLPNADATTDSV